MLQKKSIFIINLLSLFIVFITVLFIVISTISILKMSLASFIATTIFLMLFHLIFIKDQWRSQYPFIKKTVIITGFLIIIFSSQLAFFNGNFFYIISRYLCIGLISISFFMPIVFDQILRLISFNENISFFSEALILYRNVLNGTANEFIFGLRSSEINQKRGILGNIKKISLISITLIGWLPQINNDFLISAHIRHFCIHDIINLFHVQSRYILIISISIIGFFIIYLRG